MVGRRRNLGQEKEKLCCNKEGKASKTLLGLVRVAAQGQVLVGVQCGLQQLRIVFLCGLTEARLELTVDDQVLTLTSIAIKFPHPLSFCQSTSKQLKFSSALQNCVNGAILC